MDKEKKDKKLKEVDLSQYEDIEESDDYSTPCVIAYDSEDDVENK